MKKILLIFIFFCCFALANNLPELGDYSSSKISENDEMFIGRQILFQVNQSRHLTKVLQLIALFFLSIKKSISIFVRFKL